MEGRTRPLMPWWFFALFIGLGVIFIAIGGYLTGSSKQFLGKAHEVQGIISDSQVRTDIDEGDMFSPVIEFATQDGETVHFVSSVSSSSPPHIGQPVTVLYDPASPKNARIKSWASLWMLPALLLGLGGLMFVLGLVLLLTIGKKRVSADHEGVGLDMAD